MRDLVKRHGKDADTVIREYARLEEAGLVRRKSNRFSLSATQYAEALWSDGLRKGWF